MKILSFLLLLSVLAPALARADDDIGPDLSAEGGAGVPGKGNAKIIYRKRTNVSFDDAVVEGATNNPEGVYVVTPPEKKFGSLLKLRPNFHRELMRDALLLK
jgi:hypothetical protein